MGNLTYRSGQSGVEVTSGDRARRDESLAMHKLIFEFFDGNQGSLCEPVFLENLLDLPMGVKQAVEDFIEAHDGEIATPIVVTARMESDEATPCFPFEGTGDRWRGVTSLVTSTHQSVPPR